MCDINFSLAYRLANTALVPTFQKSLWRDWKGSLAKTDSPDFRRSENVAAIQRQARSELLTFLDMFRRDNSQVQVFDYLPLLASHHGVKILAKEKRGTVKKIGFDDYLSVQAFIQASSKLRLSFGQSQSQFQTHELLFRVAKYLALKDAVENGTGLSQLDKTFDHLLRTKTPDYFLKGYTADLVLHDRESILKYGDICFVRTPVEYLSTITLGKDAGKENDPAFEVFRVA